MKLVCVGGLSSGCGKTSVVCMLLKALPGWAAIKVTPSRADDVCPRGDECSACKPPEGPYEVTVDGEIGDMQAVGLRHKDTGRFLEAGASHVAFVRALPENLPAALESALGRLDGVPGVVIESTTAMRLIHGLRVMVSREGQRDAKDSARRSIGFVDLFAVNSDADSADHATTSDIPLAAE